MGSFDCVKKVNEANVVVIPHGHDANGAQIVDPVVTPTPVVLPASTTSPAPGSSPSNATPSGVAQDPNAALVQGALTATQVMTQRHIQSDLRNASMTQQQAQLQAATMRSNVQQLEHLTSHLGNLGYEVGKAIASHPADHSHAIQATLSHPDAVTGQSTDLQVLGSPTRTIPVSVRVWTCDCGPHAQAFQPQPNDKNTRRIDEATHQIVQRCLPPLVKICCDAAHTSGVVLAASDHVGGFTFVVETAIGKQHQVRRKCFLHPSLGTGCVTSSGFMPQPNIQEREFGCCAPSLKGLDPLTVRMFHLDLCRVAHDCGICLPACEEFQPEDAFSTIECGDTPTAHMPKFCQSQVPRWEDVAHHHLKRDKVIPSSHPQANEIKHNPNGCEALNLLITPCHLGHTDNGILIKPHPQQGRRSLDDHFCRCEFHCCGQQCCLNTSRNWTDAIHFVCFLDSCQHADVLRTLHNQERHAPAAQRKFKRERIVAVLKEHMASPSFLPLGGRPAATMPTGSAAVTSLTTRPAGSNTRCRFGRSNGRANGGGGTQCSGDTGRSPRDRNVRAVEAAEDSLILDDDLSADPSDDLIVAKLNGDCLGGCGKVHPPCECPNLVGHVGHQKKTFAGLSGWRHFLPVQAITTADGDDDDIDLVNLHDPEDQDSDADQDFPQGRLHVLLVVLAHVAIGAMLLSAETRIRPQPDCLPQHQLVQTKFLWHPRCRCQTSVMLPLLTSGEG